MGVIDIALSQEGTKEATGKNDVKYNDWYYGRHVSGGSYPWCAVFVSWCCAQAGISQSIVPKTASVSTLYSFFKNSGRFQPKGNGYRPKAGDILIQKSGGASHTGFVYSSDDSKFYTIEGNTSNGVHKRSYSYNDSRLTGFGTPDYDGTVLSGDTGDISDDTNNTGMGGASGGSLGVGRYDYSAYTVKKGDTVEDLAKKYNCSVDMIMFVNNLESTELKEGQTLQIPTASGIVENPTSGVLSIEKKHSQLIEVSHPTIQVEFFGEYGRLAAVGSEVTSEKHLDKDIISVSTVRNMGQDCPTFTISLVWRNNWYQNLSSNDMVIIYMQRPPETKVPVFFGLIDDIRKVTDYSSGQPQRAVQVTGRGFNKALVNFDVGLIEGITTLTAGSGWFSNFHLLGSCDSYDAISMVLDSYVGKAIKYSFGNDKLFEDYFRYDGNHHSNETLINYMSYSSYNGSLWNFIKELGNAPFNETYWEIWNDRPSLVHRRTPFNKEDWIALPYNVVKDYDIVSDNTGRSDLETYTLYAVQMSVGEETLTNAYPPLWYPPYYAKCGLTMLEVVTNYQIQDEDYSSAMGSLYSELFNFNIKNNKFSNGTIVVKGKACYKVGERVIMESDGMEYYVESVTHTFNCYGTWTTSLGVTRGLLPEDRFTPPFGCGEEMTPDVMFAILSQTSGEEIDWANLPAYTGNDGNGFYQGVENEDLLNTTTDYNASTGTPAENEVEIYNIVKGWGLNTAACAAVLANINAESGFKTEVWGDNHTSLGLCQWHNERCTRMQNYCRQHGYSITSVKGQLEYLKHELQTGYKSTWNALTSAPNTAQGAYEAAKFWCIEFERPSDKYRKGNERGNSAKNVYFRRYVNGVGSSSSGGGDGSWLNCVEKVKSMLASTGLPYSQSVYTTYDFGGFRTKVHPDCSGTVTAMLSLLWGKALSQWSSYDFTDKKSLEGFTKLNWPGWNGLQKGDIIARHGHVEVFSHNSGSTHYVYNAGSTKSVRNPNPTVSGHSSYTTVWRKS